MYYTGIVYPRASLLTNAHAFKDGYVINPEDIPAIVKSLVGTPVTYNHVGIVDACNDPRPIADAIKVIGIEKYRKTGNGSELTKTPVGVITDSVLTVNGIRVIMRISARAINDLIKSGHICGLSLTHLSGHSDALEVSVTSTPARPGCKIDQMVQSYETYKDAFILMEKEGTMESTMTPIMTALSTMSAEDRKLVEERMTAMYDETVRQRDAAIAEKSKREELETAEITERDYQYLLAQVEEITSKLSPDDKVRHGIAAEPSKLVDGLIKQCPKMTAATCAKLLCACSATMSLRREPVSAPGSAPRAKRSLPTDTEIADVKRHATDDAVLHAVFREKFELPVFD